MKETSLSEKEVSLDHYVWRILDGMHKDTLVIDKHRVREAVLRLKGYIEIAPISQEDLIYFIDKIFGEKLTKDPIGDIVEAKRKFKEETGEDFKLTDTEGREL